MHRHATAARRLGLATMILLAAASLVLAAPASAKTVDPAGLDVPPTPRARCGPGSHPETGAQGRVPAAEVESGRAAEGYRCNAVQVSHVGPTGGYKVERYVDAAGRECAYYDTTLLFPANARNAGGGEPTGVAVLDMTDPEKPVRTTTLVSPAMQTPHESMSLNATRGLLAAVTANPVFYPGILEIYDVSADCRAPVLKSSTPLGGLGHESGWAPDGRTFYVAALHAPVVTAVDVADPAVPKVLGVYQFLSHGLSISDDGNRLYMATYSNRTNNNAARGMVIYDVSEIQARKPNPQMREVSRTTWALVSTPQINVPVTIKGRPYLIEMDEFAAGDRVGAARIIDIADEIRPRVVSNLRLEVHQAAARAGDQRNDPGASSGLQGYAGHYCNVPSRIDPGIVACTFILSGLRVFDIRDPRSPREVAYFNGPIRSSAYAMSSPAFVPERREIWYSDGNSGFYAVRLTNGAWPTATAAASHAQPEPESARAASSAPTASGTLPATGATQAGSALLLALPAFAIRAGLRRARRAGAPADAPAADAGQPTIASSWRRPSS